MKATKLLQILKRDLGYRIVGKRGKGSHRMYRAEGRPTITWGFHNKRNLAPREVRNILVKDAGLSLEEAKEVLNVD